MNSPLFCGNCRTLHPADQLNHFELLGLNPIYNIDLTELRRKYLHSSRDIHPDHHGDATADPNLSLRTSARLNEAYRVLVDPLLRAEYLLELAGGKSSTQDKNVPQEILNQTLMLREDIEEAQAADDQDSLSLIQQQIYLLYDQTADEVAKLALQLSGTDQTRRQLRQKLNAVKYYQKLLEQF